MKRYREYSISCVNNQSIFDLLDKIELQSVTAGYQVQRYNTFIKRDSLAVNFEKSGFPKSQIILSGMQKYSNVKIVDIKPLPNSGVSLIDKETYNKILSNYSKQIIKPLAEISGNKITTNNEDFTIQEIIPLSCSILDTWLNTYPLSGHQCDTERWYDFIIALHKNNESIPLDIFEDYIKENYKWNDEDIHRFKLKLESEFKLIEYYDKTNGLPIQK